MAMAGSSDSAEAVAINIMILVVIESDRVHNVIIHTCGIKELVPFISSILSLLQPPEVTMSPLNERTKLTYRPSAINIDLFLANIKKIDFAREKVIDLTLQSRKAASGLP